MTFIRKIDIMTVDVSEAETEKLMAALNSDPNISTKSPLLFFLGENCADNSKRWFNVVFPHSVHRSIKDFFMTSPTAVMKGATNVGRGQPERLMRSLTIAQLPGTSSYSGPVRNGMENAWKQPYFAVPLALMAPHYGIAFTVLSLIDYRNKDAVVDQYPNLAVAKLRLSESTLEKLHADKSQIQAAKAEIDEKVQEAAHRDDPAFASYQAKFADVIRALSEKRLIDEEQVARLGVDKNPRNYLKNYEGKSAQVETDPSRGLLLTFESKDGRKRTAGLTPANIEKEDASLGFEIAVGAVNYMLAVPPARRGTLAALKKNWGIMTRLGQSLGLAID
jgi:hypothetical protein